MTYLLPLRSVAARVIVIISCAACIVCAALYVSRAVHAGQSAAISSRAVTLGLARPGTQYAVTLAVKDPAQLQGNDGVHVTVSDAKGEVDSKWLHTADL